MTESTEPSSRLNLAQVELGLEGGHLSSAAAPAPEVGGGSQSRLRLLARKVSGAVATLLLASTLVFLATQAMPSNVAAAVLGPNATPERIAQIERDLGLDRPLIVRYFDWLAGIFRGDFGESTSGLAQGNHLPVSDIIATPMGNTLILMLVTIVVFIPVTLFLGMFSAIRAGRPSDRVISTWAVISSSIPEFLTASVLVLVFFVNLDMLPPTSTLNPGQSPLSDPRLLVLPSATLLFVSVAYGTRLVRASTLEILHEEYVTMARLNGFAEHVVLFRYVLRNSIAPNIEVLASILRYLLGGVTIVEAYFAYPGIGVVLLSAVKGSDLQTLSVVSVLLAALYIGINVVCELVIFLLTPKLRTK